MLDYSEFFSESEEMIELDQVVVVFAYAGERRVVCSWNPSETVESNVVDKTGEKRVACPQPKALRIILYSRNGVRSSRRRDLSCLRRMFFSRHYC